MLSAVHPILRLALVPLLAATLVLGVAPVGQASAATHGERRLVVVDVRRVQPATTLPEAPSSITAKDQTRGALVLGATLAVMLGFVAIATLGARRRHRRPPP